MASAGPSQRERCRFAPSTTGPAHPGTLLAALLCWLDARSRGADVLLRLEDLDPQRCKPQWREQLQSDLAWLGLDWDAVQVQSQLAAQHAAALDTLEAAGRLYPCRCSRANIRSAARRSADGGWAYPNTCRGRPLPPGGWRACHEPIRFRLPAGPVLLSDESGVDLGQDPTEAMGDPIVRRRDGAVAYQLAVVCDDAASRVTRVVRGRDLAASTATQVALQRCLGLPQPTYRHHLLLLEPHGNKLAKLHGSVGADALRRIYGAPALCGILAHAAGLLDRPAEVSPAQLVTQFDWRRVERDDRIMYWDGRRLQVGPTSAATAAPA